MSLDDHGSNVVSIDGEVYSSEYIGENPEEFVISTNLSEYNLGEVNLELRGSNNLENNEVEILNDLYEETFDEGDPELLIRVQGKMGGIPLKEEKLEDIPEMLQRASKE